MSVVRMIASMALIAGIPLMAMGDSTKFLGRGVNIAAEAPENAFAAFAATGGNLVRLTFPNRPLRNMTPPYAFNQENMALLDHDLDICQKYGLNVVIDPHTFPGEEFSQFTTRPTDPIFSDAKYLTLAAELWTAIAKRESQRGSVVAGYDLMNEPALPNMGPRGTPADYNAIVRRLIQAIRSVDATHPIIIEAPNLFDGTGRWAAKSNQAFGIYFDPPPANVKNLIYSFHMYQPSQLTGEQLANQGTGQTAQQLKYPGVINGEMWNWEKIAEYFAPALAFQKKYKVQIYVGEFSATRWTGDNGNRWLHDVINYMEVHHWSWTYHEWRGGDMWDAEKTSNPNDKNRYPSTPRLNLLKSYWKLGDRP